MANEKKKTGLIQWQLPMQRVLYALVPIIIASIYFFGWQVLLLLAITNGVGFLVEFFFLKSEGKPVSSAIFVTGTLLALSLPPTIPFWMAAVGMAFASIFGKMVFGGFGKNIFNPALSGRAFLYVSFGMFMTNRWVNPAQGVVGGLLKWLSPDSVTSATPLKMMRDGSGITPLWKMLVGYIPGSLGETSAVLIILCGLYIIWKKAANYRIVVSGIAGMLILQTALWLAKAPSNGGAPVADPLSALLSGGFLFGIFFFATDPISACQTDTGRWIYGAFIGIVSAIIRTFSAWPEGIMFAILIGNMFAPITDYYIKEYEAKKKEAAKRQKELLPKGVQA